VHTGGCEGTHYRIHLKLLSTNIATEEERSGYRSFICFRLDETKMAVNDKVVINRVINSFYTDHLIHVNPRSNVLCTVYNEMYSFELCPVIYVHLH